ncbi:MFS transporter [Nitratidesulfovibrio liaohensis]|uniref:MFS transporter n=1 Tax=Nitratidesulfovibrio liaohensis TaxID=2604158 RepID=UPI001423AC75|nr:MFS transporter [Nitratidesulfovibrio liaohensis]NHZ46432.1 MFS transporter [Nitratidesulfovibrio liaohensis]
MSPIVSSMPSPASPNHPQAATAPRAATTEPDAQPDRMSGHGQGREMSGALVLLMAAAAGLCVASIYYNQPMLGILARAFHAGQGEISLIPILTQAGYAAGLLLLTPLGDRLERRGLIVWSVAALAVALVLSGFTQGLWALAAASLAVGALATVAQQIVPMAAQLAPDNQKGRVVGLVMAGLLSGILLSRTVSGLVSEYASWRLLFWAAGGVCAVLAAVLAARLPMVRPATTISYPRLLLSLLQLFRTHGLLRRSGLVQGLLFAGFVSFWASLAFFLEQPPFRMGSSVAGALGVIGIVGVMAAPLAGRLADKWRGQGGNRRIIVLGAAAVAASFALFWAGRASMAALVAGIILMDAGLQASMVANQARVYALDAGARSRLNTVYMTMMFVGGALGTAIGAQAFAHFGWAGVCGFGAASSLLGFACEYIGGRA